MNVSGKALPGLVQWSWKPLLVAGGSLCGFAWGHDGLSWLICLAVVMPLLWSLAGSRWCAGSIALAYYLAGSRGLPFGAGIFFAESAPAGFSWVLWLVASILNAMPWLLLWSQNPRRQAWTLPTSLILTALPPLGFIGWTNPLTAAGIFFPELGFSGLVVLLACLVAVVLRRWQLAVLVAGVSFAANVSAVLWVKPTPWVASWSGQDTHFARLQTDAKPDLLGEGQRVMQILMIANQVAPGRVVVLPETVLPRVHQGNQFAAMMLADVSDRLIGKGSVILVGAEVAAPGRPLQNALIVLGATGGPLVQRVPVPIGMWRPWAAESIAANPLASGVSQVAGRKVAYSICYEQLLVFPILISMVQKPDLILGAANDWWARDTSIPIIQAQALDLWGRLFGSAVVKATNI